MSESDAERAARSVALEEAYVHEVYEQCAERTAHSRPWPRIYQFLEELEPGALVCDVGCGNGKYLSVNHNVFKVGVDRCKRLTNIAREKEKEVLVCDNLDLPFRDESFDAVLSIAVVHHFATTERRVHALKELARILRIGGRLVISVWAMEQRHRKFESQDVLVPWPKAYCINSSSSWSMHHDKSTRGKRAQSIPKCVLKSQKNNQQKGKKRSYYVDPLFSPSPSTSSLSSPNETCYSFFRRALQKLAGGRRGDRPWFLDSWQNGNAKWRRNYEAEDAADVDDLPIELRRLEDLHLSLDKHQDSLSKKSKSLDDMVEIQRLDLVRSRSSIPGFCSTVNSELDLAGDDLAESCRSSSLGGSKPRLVKQKSCVMEESDLDTPENTAIITDLPELQIPSSLVHNSARGSVHKQSSMNEELMSAERLRERDRLRCNITKQASLNEDLMYKRRAFESLKDSLYSGNATKRFQLLKSGLTNKIKQSTTNIERVSGMSIKNGFVRILQSWMSSEAEPSEEDDEETGNDSNTENNNNNDDDNQERRTSTSNGNKYIDGMERRPSREDGSDSSKDSSLQSDTSVDSEDSFASVIYVPKQSDSVNGDDNGSNGSNGGAMTTNNITTTSTTYQMGTTSAPPSPRVKHPPDMSGPRIKLIQLSPLLKQFPATSKSLPPPSPPGLSPRTLNNANSKPFFSSNNSNSNNEGAALETQDLCQASPYIARLSKGLSMERKPAAVEAVRGRRSISEGVPTHPVSSKEAFVNASSLPGLKESPERKKTSSGPKTTTATTTTGEEESRKNRLNQIKLLLQQKPGFATRAKASLPLVRRASSAHAGRLETVSKVLPRLMSLELFNPETDDLDSDSSGVSSPDSSSSVISVISDERYLLKKEAEKSASEKSNENSQSKTSAGGKTGESAASKENQSQNGANAGSKGDKATSEDDNKLVEKLGEDLIHDIDQYCQRSRLELSDDCDELDHPLKNKSDSTKSKSCKYSNLSNTIAWLEQSTGDNYNSTNDNKPSEHSLGSECSNGNLASQTISSSTSNNIRDYTMHESGSEEAMELNLESEEIASKVTSKSTSRIADIKKDSEERTSLKFCNSLESSDIGDSIENTTSLSDNSRTESMNMMNRPFSDSTASLGSLSADRSRISGERRKFRSQIYSLSDEASTRGSISRLNSERGGTTVSTSGLSESSSQESLLSDRNGGGAITYHQYYHVFKVGELDALINKYVENLHIISSYYDHASWCIVAEKVQVWTI